jgi:hypothetical protein
MEESNEKCIYFIDGTLAKQNPHSLYFSYLEKKCNLKKFSNAHVVQQRNL